MLRTKSKTLLTNLLQSNAITMMAFLDLDDEAAAIEIGSLLTSRSSLHAFMIWGVIAIVYHSLITILAWGGLEDLRESGFCWWQVSRRKQTCCRHSRYFQCQRRRNRRRKEKGKPWECPLTRLHNHFCNMPPPLPFHRRKAENRQTGSEAASELASNDGQSPKELVVSSRPITEYPQKATLALSRNPPATPSIALIDLARMQQWSRLIERVTSQQREARQVDSDGLMPLHWACSGGPPLEVIEALLRAYPRAARHTDSDDSTALHFACHYGGSAPVVQALLKAYPCAVYKKDKYGRTPLYHAVNKSSNSDVIKILVKAEPSMSIEPCVPPIIRRSKIETYGKRPLLHRTPLYVAWLPVSASPTTRRRRRNGKVWEKAVLLLEAADRHQTIGTETDSNGQYKFRMLHSVIKLDSFLPPHAIHLALERFPEQIRQFQEQDGRLPLAIAADSQSLRALEIIKLLCEAYPQAARACDSDGRTPLAIALACGKQWHQGVETLFQIAPDVLTRRDQKTLLYPALIAASARGSPHGSESATVPEQDKENIALLATDSNAFKNKSSQWRAQVTPILNKGSKTELVDSEWDNVDPDSRQLSTVYNLFRASPSIVSW